MKVDWSKTIEGLPIKIVRDMMRNIRYGRWTSEEIADETRRQIVKAGRHWLNGHNPWRVNDSHDADFILSLPKDVVQIVIGNLVWSPARIKRIGKAMTHALLAEGFIRRRRLKHNGDYDEYYEATNAGIRLSAANVARRIDRAEAERHVIDLLARTDALNADAKAYYRVKAIWVYGSYAKGANNLGDIDLMIDLVRPSGDVYRALADDQNERLDIIERLGRRARQRLRNRNRHLHIIFSKDKVTGPVVKIYPRDNREARGLSADPQQ